MKMTQKPFHPGWTLIDRSPEELLTLLEKDEISEGDITMQKWRKAMLHAQTADPEIKRYHQMKEKEKQAATAPK